MIASKTRMAPLKVIDIVKLELCGAVLGTRLRATIEAEMRIKFDEVRHIVDSEIVHAMVRKQSYGFNTFAANRIGEIQRGTNANEWYWIPGKPWLNVADMTTRGCLPKEINSGSIWQQGPDFLKMREEEWPMRQDVQSTVTIPKEFVTKFVGATNQSVPLEKLSDIFNIQRFSRWRRLVRTTVRIISLTHDKQQSSGGTSAELTAETVQRAEEIWIKEAQRSLKTADCKKLNPTTENDLIVVGGRTERWMQATWNRQKFILLPNNHHIAELIARHEHQIGGHLGVESTIAKIRSKYWIINIQRIVRKLLRDCVSCIKKRKQTG